MNGTDLTRTWRSLVKIFPTVTIGFDLFFSPSSWRLLGVDLLRGPQLDRKSRKAAALLAENSIDDIDRLLQWARLNAQRATNLFNAVSVAYVSLPLALGAFASDIAPDAARNWINNHLSELVPLVFGLAFAPAVYFCALWRARQIVWTIELFRLGAVPLTAPQSSAPPAQTGEPRL